MRTGRLAGARPPHDRSVCAAGGMARRRGSAHVAHVAYLALGANVGDRRHNLRDAVGRLGGLPETTVTAVSALYETDPVGGPPGQPNFLNAVVAVKTLLAPRVLLSHCAGIERDLGRLRAVPNGPRTIDIDILVYDDLILDSADLMLPHPRLHQRSFVLQPLAELAPNLVPPGLTATIRDLLRRLPDAAQAGVRLFESGDWSKS